MSESRIVSHLSLVHCIPDGDFLTFLFWTSAVFLNAPEANQLLLQRGKRANSIMEELKQGDLERECLEEKCSYEEAREILIVPENLEEFWRNYSEEDECESAPCHNGGTCMDQTKSYTCICPHGFEGKDCQLAERTSFGCLYRNGGCEHFCADVPDSPPQCRCAAGYALANDSASCVEQVAFPCGRVTEAFSPRIVRGQVCPKGECPWQALLEYNGEYMCGGILLDATWVLTAAHCVWRANPSRLRVTLGEHIRFVEEGTEQARGVAKVTIHPNYDHVSSDNDIALLQLSRAVEIGQFVLPVCVPPQGGSFIRVTLASMRTSVVSGWGKMSQSGPEAQVLQRLEVPRVTLQECQQQTNLTLTPNMLCAGFLEGEQDSCQGDSGGPLVTRYKNTWFLSGIVSWGKGCAQSGFYGIYTRVANYLNWIDGIVSSPQAQGHHTSS
uniref:Coagulation factor VII, like n=1 Tax=Paramormyrops kingsleyae TaxID=1676925 RepID=A0A3B3SAZ3_9TELE